MRETGRFLMWSLWPSFLVAGLGTGLFFSSFDPHDLRWFGGEAGLSRMAAYTLGFFFFWAMCSLAALLALWLSRPQRNAA